MNWKSAAILLVVMAGLPGCVDQAAQQRAWRAQAEQDAAQEQARKKQQEESRRQEERAKAEEGRRYAETHAVTMTKGLQAAVETAVRTELKDPNSATFKHYRAFRDKDGALRVCGAVNSKNSFGGYVGFTPFVAYVSEVGGGKYQPNGAIIATGGWEAFYMLNPECGGS